jgi:hypothetical protein
MGLEAALIAAAVSGLVTTGVSIDQQQKAHERNESMLGKQAAAQADAVKKAEDAEAEQKQNIQAVNLRDSQLVAQRKRRAASKGLPGTILGGGFGQAAQSLPSPMGATGGLVPGTKTLLGQ